MDAIQKALVANVTGIHIDHEPFPHVYLPKVFPDDFYRELRESLPADDEYKLKAGSGSGSLGSYAGRSVYDFSRTDRNDPPTRESQVLDLLNTSVLSEPFIRTFLQKFELQIIARFGGRPNIRISANTALIRDYTTYGIGPHTDIPNRLVSILVYLPEDDSLNDLGTSLYTPKQQGFTCEGGPRYESDDFNLVLTAPYLPNTALAFPVSNISFHGREPIKSPSIKRDLLLVSLTWS